MLQRIHSAAAIVAALVVLGFSAQVQAQSDEQENAENTVTESGEGIVRGLYADDGTHCRK